MANAPRLSPRLSGRFGTLLPVSLFVTLGLVATAVQGQQPQPAAAAPAPAPVCLDELVRLGLERQPSVAAARASLASAEAGRQALDNLGLVSALRHDIPVRRQQACLGVTVAAAGVTQAEWETIYAVTRNYFSTIYAREQQKVAKGLLDTLRTYETSTQQLLKLKGGDPDLKVSKGDVDKLAVTADLFQLRLIEATKGSERAQAALREALGVEPCFPLLVVGQLPPLQEVPCRQELINLALARRGEMIQAANGARVVELEVCAQSKVNGLNVATFASGADLHARPVPQGISNKEYRPGALAIEMPTTLSGHKEDRVQRARDLSARAAAVVDKTRNLIVLETEDAYLKWSEAAEKLQALRQTLQRALGVRKAAEARLQLGDIGGEDLIRSKTLEVQVQAQYNEALYEQALALAALERITAGGFTPTFRGPPVLVGP
jgi:outer membrane protein TolC